MTLSRSSEDKIENEDESESEKKALCEQVLRGSVGQPLDL